MPLTTRHCEERSDEAIQTYSSDASLDCFASLAMTENLAPHTSLSSPGLTGRSSTPRPLRITAWPLEYWIPAFAGMTAVFVSRAAMPTN
jgi:hypothetical protein